MHSPVSLRGIVPLVTLGIVSAAGAQSVSNTPAQPPPNADYSTGTLQTPVTYPPLGPGQTITRFRINNPNNNTPPPFPANSFFDVFVELDTGGGPLNGIGHATEHIGSGVPVNADTTTYPTEMLQLDISGGSFPPGQIMRESPTLPSVGQTTITDLHNGNFRIDSFFDVFTELSVDGGANWFPASGPLHIVLPEPGSLSALAVASLTLLRRRR